MTTPTSRLDPVSCRVESVVAAIDEALDRPVEVRTLTPDAYAALVAECARARARLQSLELRLIAEADRAEVAHATGMVSTGAWVAKETRSDQSAAARQVSLAHDLDERPSATSEALSSGLVSTDHATVIAEATRRLPSGLTGEQAAEVERVLVQKAQVLDPRGLRKAARRALEAVERDTAVVDAHEERLLQDEETRALSRARLTWHDHGDGTTSGHFTVPTLAASILAKVLDAMTSPRRGRLGRPTPRRASRDSIATGPTSAAARSCSFSSTSPPTTSTRRPRPRSWSGSTSTPSAGSSRPPVSTPANPSRAPTPAGSRAAPASSRPSSAELRRRSTSAARSACSPKPNGPRWGCPTPRAPPTAATGPYAWCELHHHDPWSRGGSSDLANAVPLCGFHHRRVHDPRYDHRRSAAGSLTFRRRR